MTVLVDSNPEPEHRITSLPWRNGGLFAIDRMEQRNLRRHILDCSIYNAIINSSTANSKIVV